MLKTIVIKSLRVKKLLLLFLFLFVAAGLSGCSDDDAVVDNNNNNSTPKTNVPEKLVGTWSAGNVSSVNFFNPNTGAWAAPSGTGMFYKFTQNGYYEKGVLLQSSLYGCTMTFHAFNQGTVTVEGNAFTFYPTYGRIKSEDNCVQNNNYEKPDEISNEVILWELGIDEYGNEVLWLRSENGNPSAFYRI